MFGSGSFNIHLLCLLREALGFCLLYCRHALKLNLPVKPEAFVTLGIRSWVACCWWAEGEQLFMALIRTFTF